MFVNAIIKTSSSLIYFKVSFAMKYLCAPIFIARSVYKEWRAPGHIMVVFMEPVPVEFQFSASDGWKNYCLVSHKQGIKNANWNWFSKNKCLHAGFSCLCNMFSDFSV